jgi:hypothetical protein
MGFGVDRLYEAMGQPVLGPVWWRPDSRGALARGRDREEGAVDRRRRDDGGVAPSTVSSRTGSLPYTGLAVCRDRRVSANWAVGHRTGQASPQFDGAAPR